MKAYLCLSVLFFAVSVLSVTETTPGQDPAIAANYNISESSSAECGDEENGGGQDENWPEGQMTLCEALRGTCVVPGKERCITKFYEGDDLQCKARYDDKHLCCMHPGIADAPCTEHGTVAIPGLYSCLNVNVCENFGGTVLKATHLCGGPRCRKCCRLDFDPGNNLASSGPTTKSEATATQQVTTTKPQPTTKTPHLAETTSESAGGMPELTISTSQPPDTTDNRQNTTTGNRENTTTDNRQTTSTDNRQTTTLSTQSADHLTTTSGTNETCDELYQAKPFVLLPLPFLPQPLCHDLGGHCVDMTKERCETKYFDGSLQCKEAFGANFGCCMDMETADGQCTALGPKFECMDAKKCEPNKGEVIPARGLCGGPPCRMCCRLN